MADIDTTYLDNDTDSIKAARPALLEVVQRVNSLATAGGAGLIGGAGHVISSITALRALLKTSPSKNAFVTGYYAAGDGGGGAYWYDATDTTTADNGGTIIVATDGGRWKLAHTGRVSVEQFGAKTDGADAGAAILAAHTYAQAAMITLEFDGGEYTVGAASSFVIDPQKTRWKANGQAELKWSAAPVAGYGIRVVAGDAAAYETGRKMIANVIDGIAIIGGASAGGRYNAHGLEIGDGTNHTYGIRFSNVTIQGWTQVVFFRSNVWSVRFENPRFLWGDIQCDGGLTNFGENMQIHEPFFADNANVNLTNGDWTITGGSLDNSQLYVEGITFVRWFSPHFENPGQVGLVNYYVSLSGANATVHLYGLELVTNFNGVPGAITTYPFYVPDTITVGGLFVDGFRFTQAPDYAYSRFVLGNGRTCFKNVVPMALANAYHMAMASNHAGALRSWDCEALDGWTQTVTGTSSIYISPVRYVSAANSALFQCQGGAGFVWAYATQKQSCSTNQYVAASVDISRDFTGLNAGETGVISCKVEYLDTDGAIILSSNLGNYTSAPNGTNDANFAAYRYAGLAPAGTKDVQVRLEFQRPSGTGTAKFYVDNVVLNVCQ